MVKTMEALLANIIAAGKDEIDATATTIIFYSSGIMGLTRISGYWFSSGKATPMIMAYVMILILIFP